MDKNYLIAPPSQTEGDGIRNFMHITHIQSDRFEGLQLKYSRPQLAYAARKEVELELALRDAIWDRNQRYEALGYPPSLLRAPMSLSVKDDSWESGWRHITITHEYRRGDRAKPVQVVSFNAPDLETGRRTTWSRYAEQYGSLKATIAVARQEYERLVRRYNNIVKLANTLQVELRLRPAAQLELVTLRPWLKYQRDTDGRIYRRAYRENQAMVDAINERWSKTVYRIKE